MPIRDGDLEIEYMTLRDASLTHQIILQEDKGTIKVSCNCRLTYNTGACVGYSPIGVTANIEDTRMLYNDAANHLKPFTEADHFDG
jgi:hypothetical protein